jgi:hypothetical protein
MIQVRCACFVHSVLRTITGKEAIAVEIRTIHRTFYHLAIATAACLCLAVSEGCGGGGGSASSPAPSVSLTLVSPAQIQATVLEGTAMPNQTIQVQASGDLNSLAGQTIYVEIVDPDSLFNHTALSVSQGPSGTYSTTLTGQVLSTLAHYTGNLQILVSTNPTFSSQLGNSPLSLPFDVTVAQGILGTSLVTSVPFTATTGTLTAATPVPNNLPIIKAILANGTVVPGTYTQATGAYTIPAVPTGNYWLYANDSYIWTGSKTVNLGWTHTGRNATLDTLPVSDTFNITGMAAWQANDYLVAFDCNSDLYLNWSGPANGNTSTTASLPWSNLPLIDTTNGDSPQVTQYASAANGTVHISTPTMAYALTGLTMTNGVGGSLNVPLAALPQTDTVYVNFKRSQFAAYRTEYNPGASVTWGPFIQFDSFPGAAVYGSADNWLDGVAWQDSNSASTADVNIGTIPSPPLAPGFERVYYAGETHYMSLTAPGASTPFTYRVKGTRTYTLTPTSNTAPLQVTVSPVKNPTINGKNLFTGQTGVGLAPTLSWTAPDVGTPNAYVVTVYLLNNNNGATQSTQVNRLFLPGSVTTTTLPAGLLLTGQAYAFLISAYVDSSYDPTTAPWVNHKFPYGLSQSISGVVTP